MPPESLAHIALQPRPEDVLADAVATARRLTGADSAFGAVARRSGAFAMTLRDGLADPRWARIAVREGRGLGGRVLAERRPCVAEDYLHDATITGDYRTVVRAEGLRGIACVPVTGPDGTAALLYAGERAGGAPGDRLVDALARIADMACVGLTVAARGATPAPEPAVRLTPREHDVLDLLAEGASNRRIAERLVLAEPTVKGYVRALLEKFEATSRLEVVARARRQGLA